MIDHARRRGHAAESACTFAQCFEKRDKRSKESLSYEEKAYGRTASLWGAPITATLDRFAQPDPSHSLFFSYVLLGGTFYNAIIHFSSYGVGFTTVEVVALGLSALLSVVLCIVSGLTYAFARAWQWREGRKLGMRGLAVGVMGVFLGVGVLVITFFVERSHLAPTHIPAHLW